MKRHFADMGLGLLALSLSAFAHAAPLTKESPEAYKSATGYMTELDTAMTNAASVLQSGNLTAVGEQSKNFSSLVSKGRNQFGASTFEPLGSCSAAGTFAQSWWTAQVNAASKGGKELTAGSIQNALSDFQASRKQCLDDVQPVTAQQAKTEAGRECLTVYTLDPKTQDLIEKPKPAHCKS